MPRAVRTTMLLPALAGAAIAISPAISLAADPYVAVKGAHGAGPAKYDRTWVRMIGPRSAKRVLVLVPGTFAGSGTLTTIARDITRRVPDLQVWAWDRRANAFEDTFGFRTRDPNKAFRYYLQGQEVGGRRFKPVQAKDAGYVRDWGLQLSLEDLRHVVLKAGDGGRRKVILGGHSLGASTAEAYAAWDFGGKPGYKDIQGLVLIDGGLMGGAPDTLAESQQKLKALRAGSPSADLLKVGLPWATGVFAEVGALYAKKKPDAPAALTAYPLLPASLKPPVPVTNLGGFGYAFDADTSPDFLKLIQVHAGALATSGDLRGWKSGELTPISRLVDAFSEEPGNAVEWYFPSRLSLDLAAAEGLTRTPATDFLKLRAFNRRKIDVPLLAFETSLSNGEVLRGARRLAKTSKVPYARLAFDSGQSHLDPLLASPRRNLFLATLVNFLGRKELR